MAKDDSSKFSRSSRIEAMREMASAISFDFTDMTTVLQFKIANIKRSADRSNVTLVQDIEKIESTLNRMIRIAKGMRSLGLAGEEDSLEDISLRMLIAGVVELSASWFKSNGITFHNEVPPDVFLRGRNGQVSQAVINLLNNAIDSCANAEKKEVRLKFGLAGQSPVCLRISVTDSGKLPPDVREKMMEPFFSTKPPGKGIGLGLNVVKSIAEAHSGRLYFEPSSPQTEFVFEIPVLEVKKQAA